MSYIIRILLPDTPGSLGRLADAIGFIGGDIQSVDVVEAFNNGTVMDDLVVSLPQSVMADSLITAAHEVEGVEVDSIRPFSGTVDRRGQIHMLAEVAGASTHSESLAKLVDEIPRVLTSSWAILLKITPAGLERVTASPAAPADDGSSPTNVAIDKARILHPENETWIPQSWALLDTALSVAPLNTDNLVLILGRVGGPDYLPSEVEHLGNLGKILGTLLHA
ncbi:amino acid-binding ACT domain protein [Corynebacterium sp. sy017]|uniref:amino acid-binding ACT domain protein n=1 Tax=unclassified Corynebacterium TaxID=2624378 RepID=UPI0011852DFC|nr:MULTISPECIES: amino acid-binding ACT domain protein [unclassified Corynebacterium]MBP3089037.1 amino acid-binding ACT domain protein [Corynebacterium sp. sy017]QDZ42401.1 amino acid-binding ACT domain protein [Corynebacterium sp. sy039]TSD91356.1 amino acid-binding ACT domain protein [Corynebacterium sp. SY003]